MIHPENKSIESGRDEQESLRLEAEAQLSHLPQKKLRSQPAVELLHELQVHQIELEMQNDELKRSQILIEECRDRFVDLYDFSPVGYFTLSAEGTVREVNLTGAALLNVDRKKMLNHRFVLLVAAEDRDLWHRHFKSTKHSGEKQSCELKLKRGEGRFFQAKLESLRVKNNDESSVRIIVSDVTEKNQMEREIQERTNEMSELHTLHVATQTAAAIAHDLNQPLLAITTYSEAALMLLKAETPDLAKIEKAISGCERQALRAGQSIRELLEFLGMREVYVEVFDLNKEIQNVLNAARMEYEMQFETQLHLEKNLPLVHASRTHVKKALFNLLRNGIEAMQDAGVPVPTITVSISIKKDENAAQVTVRDNGPGIKEEVLHRLFKPFFTTKDKGIGMGLAVSRSLIEENGGQLWIDPLDGPGATFHFTLPFAS